MWFSSETSQGMSKRLDQARQGGEHGGRPATNDPRRTLALFQPAGQQLGHKPAVPGRTVVGRDLDVDSRLAEVIQPRQQRGGSHAVKQGRR